MRDQAHIRIRHADGRAELLLWNEGRCWSMDVTDRLPLLAADILEAHAHVLRWTAKIRNDDP